MQGASSSSSSSTKVENNHSIVEIMQGDNLLSSIKEKMESLSISYCICRVPEQISKGNEDKYFPKSVSIGPFHRGKTPLKAMEDQKWRYLNALLSRRQDNETTLDLCIKRLRQLEHRARKCYGEVINMGGDEFVEMMLLDGCFIIEMLLKFMFRGLRRRDDLCFRTREVFSCVRSDLILVENQIPFFVVENLYEVVPLPKECSFSLAHLFLFFARKLIDREGLLMTQDKKFGPFVYHFLDLIRHCYLPTIPQMQSMGEEKNLYSATQLQDAGIKFRRKTLSSSSSSNQSLMDVTYDDMGGVFGIPQIKVQNHTEILLRNIIALEYTSSSDDQTKHVASYVHLMKCLVRSKQDVGFLQRKGILIISTMENNEEEILDIFNSLQHVKINAEDFYYSGMCEKVNKFHNMAMKKKKKNKKILCHKMGYYVYHKTPCGAAAFVVAILALVSSLSAALFFAITFLFHHVFN